jgi:hypothetical protein
MATLTLLGTARTATCPRHLLTTDDLHGEEARQANEGRCGERGRGQNMVVPEQGAGHPR